MDNIMIHDESFEEIKETAAALDMSVEEYFLHLHKKNRSLKCALFTDGDDFKNFVHSYQQLTDRLFHFKNKLVDDTLTKEDYEMISAIIDLLNLTTSDSFVLAQIYEIFKMKQKDPISPIQVPEA
ncbi:hypothetical protein [Pisciglobus halotolerans]|uniref:Uncharacterized protein n=1 Tax=Pisciglobus halotolerans TaxID=745365 RepID=A0A1I3DPJ6_9LACT|nr:hypothetical protein [Pisciglobus halotolerans]SFH88478.1 hypothetical protein SAMN04489868_1469 [Pisciglobus halotolerans]